MGGHKIRQGLLVRLPDTHTLIKRKQQDSHEVNEDTTCDKAGLDGVGELRPVARCAVSNEGFITDTGRGGTGAMDNR